MTEEISTESKGKEKKGNKEKRELLKVLKEEKKW